MKRRTKMMALTGVILLAGFMVLMSIGGFAANPETVNVSVTVPATIQMNMTGMPVSYGSLVPPTTDTSKTLGVTISSNKDWSLAVKKGGDLSDGGVNTIPSANFLFRGQNPGAGVTIVTGSYTQFGLADTTVATGTRGASRTLDVNYSLLIDWNVEAAAYSATHTYTATNP
jgi:hypothetical protein